LSRMVLSWARPVQEVSVAADTSNARFGFDFTNGSAKAVAILAVEPSCGCTTVKLPPLPWIVAAGQSGHLDVNVDVSEKSGVLTKTIAIKTTRGTDTLTLKITVPPWVMRTRSEAERARGMAAARADRQAVFRGECASCHSRALTAKRDGKELYESACAICHEGKSRATMVPDLHRLKPPPGVIPSNAEAFWEDRIAHGKAGTLMPAFSTKEGGPLTDNQVAAIARYLDTAIPLFGPPPDESGTN
jgi:mono/diheme cytochrome c family protein